MLFKMDENLHPDLADLFRRSGHDAATVWEEGLRGADDATILARCDRERRALLTFDLGFGDIRAYSPSKHCGIIVLRLESQARRELLEAGSIILALLDQEPLEGHLWIVDERTVRVRGL